MVVYVNGKPIFVQNPKSENNSLLDINNNCSVSKVIENEKPKIKAYQPRKVIQSTKSSPQNRPVAKIPYLLAAAAAAAASNHRKQEHNMLKYQQQNSRIISYDSTKNSAQRSNTPSALKGSTKSQTGSTPVKPVKELKQDQEYLQLVSMLKQKNEKLLFNPQILNKN